MEGTSCEMVRFCLSLPSPSVSNDLHVSIDTGFLLTLRLSNIHTQKHTHTTHTQKTLNSHSHSHAYENVSEYVLDTAARSKNFFFKKKHCGRSQAYIFSTAQDSTAVSDGTGEERTDTHFAITEKI